MFWMVLLLLIATTVIGQLLAPKTKTHPGALGDFNFPTAQEGRAIPYVFGTVKIGGGNTVWWGDLKTKPIKKRASFMSFSAQTVGYKYYIGVQYALCWGSPELVLVSINANKRNLPYSTTVETNGSGSENRLVLNVTGENLYGGTSSVGGEGGVTGRMSFYRGLASQQPNDYLTAKQGRVVVDQSGLGYTFAGHGNGTLSFLSGGASALNETITLRATSFNFTLGVEMFSVDGSISGHIGTASAAAAFSTSRINLTIAAGSIPFATGDTFTIKTLHANSAPAYKGVCYAVMEQMYVGSSSYPKPFEFIIRRCPDPFAQGPSIANIGGDGNGILAIYELMTDPIFGLGITATKFDAAAFQAAAVVIAGEGLGLSMQQDAQDTADTIIGEILRHLDGVIYTDPATGLWTVKLARADYDPTTLPVLDSSAIESIDYARGSWGETINHIMVRYLSRASNFNERTVQTYDPANINITREVRSQTLDFKLISNRTTAGLIAMRALKTMTYPIGKSKIVANRKAWNYRMAGVFKLNWPPLGIIGMIVRITHIAYGEVASGKITIDGVEDIFGINNVAFVSPPESGWVNPIAAPTPNLAELLFEAPAHFLVTATPPLGYVAIFVLSFAARDPSVAEKNYQIWKDDGTGYFDTTKIGNFCPVGLLSAAYLKGTPANDPTGFTLGVAGAVDLVDLESCSSAELFQGANLCLIDDEIMGWQNKTANGDGTVTITNVLRGLMDTIPADHALGARVWFFSEGAGNVANLAVDGTVTAKLLPMNSFGTLAIGSATPRSVTTQSRARLPYPPANVRMQGAAYAVRYVTIVGDLTITWAFRKQDYEAGRLPLVLQDAAGDDPNSEFDEFVGVDIRVAATGVALGGGIVFSPGYGLTSQFIYTANARHFAGPPGPVRVKLTTTQSFISLGGGSPPPSIHSWQIPTFDVTFTGFGLAFGQYFGGIQS